MEKIINFYYRLRKSPAQQMMVITAVGMVFKLALDVLTAMRFGITEEADALIMALLIPFFLDTIVRQSTKYSLVPIFIRFRNTKSKEDFVYFVSGLINLGTVVFLLIGTGLYLLSGFVIKVIGPGLSADTTQMSAFILKIVLPLLLFLPVITICSVFLDSLKKFNIVAFRNVILSIPAIGALLWSIDAKEGYIVVAFGYMLGYVVFGVFLFIVALRYGLKYHVKALPTKTNL